MDVKASARAKHASSQRGRARHSTRKHQPQQQQQQQQPVSDLQQSQDKKDSQLPSNWSRYEEEAAEEETFRISDIPPVKSKGANYKDLLSEKSMLQGSDLASGRKCLMITRGLDLWSRLSDMDNMWSTNEVFGEEDNFFVLNLDFLNKELSKIDIGERLLLDPEYVHHAEVEKFERGYKIPFFETADEDSSIKFPALSSPREVGGLDSSMSTGNEEFGGGGNETVVTSKFNGSYAGGSSPGRESELLDGIMHSVSKDPLVPLPKTTPLFDAQSAEAQLDALLDMLDNQTAGKAPNLTPMEAFGSTSQESHSYALQESSPLDLPVDSSHGSTSLFPNVGALNDNLLHMMGPPKLTREASTVSFHVPNVDPRNSVPNLDEDFDDWLDKL